jgi:hypothetical protein
MMEKKFPLFLLGQPFAMTLLDVAEVIELCQSMCGGATVLFRMPHAPKAPAGAAVLRIFSPLPISECPFLLSPEPIKGPLRCPSEAHHRSHPRQQLSLPPPRKHTTAAHHRSRRESEDSGHHWRSRRCEVKESTHHRHFASSPSTPASSLPSLIVTPFLPVTGEFLPHPELDDDVASLDLDPTVAYRFTF